MAKFDTLAALVDVVENLIPCTRILGVRDCRIDDDGVARVCIDRRDELVLRTGSRVAVTRMEFRNDEHTLVAVGTGTYMVG